MVNTGMDNDYLFKFYNKASEKINFIKIVLKNLKITDPEIIAKKYDFLK